MAQKPSRPRILTVMEGREDSRMIVDDLEIISKNRQWGFNPIYYFNSDKVARYDFADMPLEYVIFRDMPKNNYYEIERILEWLRKNNKIGINLNPTGGRVSTSDKHFQQGLFLLDPVLSEHALPTFEAKHKLNVMAYIASGRVHYPIVLKPRRGTTGTGITFIGQESDLDNIKDFSDLLIEQYIEPEYDWRVFVIGGAAVGIMRKNGNPNDLKNFKMWCLGHHRELEKDQDTIEILSKIACRAAEISGLEYAGVDIIRDSKTKKYYLLETNFAATWLTFVPITNISIPDLIIDWLEERGDAKNQSIKKSVKRYIENRKQYLSRKTRENYEKILNGEKGITKKCREYFKSERAKYLYDAGLIFKKLAAAYEDLTESKKPKNYQALIEEIEQMPLSWAGNFIGPEVGTLEEGAILSALYLFILGKTNKV